MGELRLTVASWDEREDLVIELTVEDHTSIEEWGLVTYDERAGKPVIDLYPRAGGGEWHFDLEEVNAILARATRRITEVAGPIASESPVTAQADAGADAPVALPVAFE